jgi:hypothetical protein
MRLRSPLSNATISVRPKGIRNRSVITSTAPGGHSWGGGSGGTTWGEEARERSAQAESASRPDAVGTQPVYLSDRFERFEPHSGKDAPPSPHWPASCWAPGTMSGVHDRFVRYTFSPPERAEAELRAVLPPRVVSDVDWSSLRRESGSVVDPELRQTETDLLFSARLRSGRPLLLYVLLEHQSTEDPWMALRMLRYVVRQLEHWRQTHPESTLLPLIVPLVMSVTCCGLGASPSTKRRGECYIPSWTRSERRR